MNTASFLTDVPWHGSLFCNGRWQSAQGSSRDVIEPATGTRLGSCGIASADDMRTAIGAAQVAQRAWAATPPRERAAVLLRAAEQLQQHFDELALAIARETGGIVPKGQHA